MSDNLIPYFQALSDNNPSIQFAILGHDAKVIQATEEFQNWIRGADPGSLTSGILEIDGRVLQVTRAGIPSGHMVMLSDITATQRREQHLQSLADTDSLTGVLNRRAFLKKATGELQRMTGDGVLVGILDVDNLKEVNDRSGHAQGDVLLKRASQKLSGVLRAFDVLGRIGGDEFAFVMSGVPKDSIPALLDRLLSSVSEDGLGSVSIGAVRATSKTFGIAALLEQADQQLLRAKSAGRNVVRFAEATLP
ncbi:MAG TPA: GGDEF domain-containing protein [Paracoccaceae bacterium]|nr:GGDEF domain-containing protein [Paracoccaceae bacterium]